MHPISNEFWRQSFKIDEKDKGFWSLAIF